MIMGPGKAMIMDQETKMMFHAVPDEIGRRWQSRLRRMELPGLLKEGDHVTVTEGVLPSNYYYTIDPSLAMSGNYPFRERMLEREGEVLAVIENERGFYVKVRFT